MNSQMFLVALAYAKSHPAEVTLAVGGLVSCFYNRLDKFPRVHAFFSVLAHAGLNVPGVADALSRLVTGKLAGIAVRVAPVAALVLMLGCGSAAQDAKLAQSLALVAVNAANDAWLVSAQACIALGDAGAGSKCAKDLSVVQPLLVKVNGDVAAGTAVLCDLGPVSAAVADVGGTPAKELAEILSAACPADAGTDVDAQ